MGLLQRDYMIESTDFRTKRYEQQKLKDKRNKKLWELYAKKNKTVIDKIQIKIIESKNIKN